MCRLNRQSEKNVQHAVDKNGLEFTFESVAELYINSVIVKFEKRRK